MIEEYIQITTIHGIIYQSKDRSLCTRLFWGLTLIAAFIYAMTIINSSYLQWETDQTVTTLESIAAPISKVQFPTVTVCPNPRAASDNWAFLSKLLEALPFKDNSVFVQKIQKDIGKKVQDNLIRSYFNSPNSKIWHKLHARFFINPIMDGPSIDFMLAEAVCRKNVTIGDIKNYMLTNFGRDKTMNGIVADLLGVSDNYGDWRSYLGDNFCPSKCCDKKIEDTFFRAIMAAGDVMLQEYSMEPKDLLLR